MTNKTTSAIVERVDRVILDRLREDDGAPYTLGFNNGVRAAQVVAHQELTSFDTETSTIDLVERLASLHDKMMDAVRRQRPYPVRIAANDSDVRTVLSSAIQLHKAADTITRLQAALERIGKRKLGGPFRGGQVVSERREMIEIAREALSSVGGE